MSRDRGKAKKADSVSRRYDNRASPVTIRRADGSEELSPPLDERELRRTVANGNAAADPRPRSSRPGWSPPGS